MTGRRRAMLRAMSIRETMAKLEALRAELSSEAHVRERAAVWRDAGPEERLEAVAEQCAAAAELLSLKDEVEFARALESRRPPPDTLALLERLQRSARR
jgi:hypothetical protein